MDKTSKRDGHPSILWVSGGYFCTVARRSTATSQSAWPGALRGSGVAIGSWESSR
jgi:hypothetical protein